MWCWYSHIRGNVTTSKNTKANISPHERIFYIIRYGACGLGLVLSGKTMENMKHQNISNLSPSLQTPLTFLVDYLTGKRISPIPRIKSQANRNFKSRRRHKWWRCQRGSVFHLGGKTVYPCQRYKTRENTYPNNINVPKHS